MIKNAKFTKKMATMLLIIGGVVGVIAIALIVLNLTTFMSQVSRTVAGGGGTAEELYKEYFVSNVLTYALNILSVQGPIAVFSLISGIMLLKSTKSDEETVVEVTEEIETTESDASADETELN